LARRAVALAATKIKLTNCWLKTTNLAQGGHRLRIAPAIPLKNIVFLIENK
jgi:hypothetical protein